MIPAGFWRRYAAWTLDSAIVGVPIALVAWPYWRAGLHRVSVAFDAVATRFAALAIDGLRSTEDPLVLTQAWLSDATLQHTIAGVETAAIDAMKPGCMAFMVVAALYWTAFECSRWQATPGKRVLGLVVADLRNQRISLPRAIARHVAGILSWLTLNLGHAMAAMPPGKRALHDYLTGTRVMQHAATALPLWARAWLLLQVVLPFAAMMWLMQSMQGALQSALYG